MKTCDNWVVLRIDGDEIFYKLLTGTSGGYLTGDSWAINSGIVGVRDEGDVYIFEGSSGSEYQVGKQSYGLRMNNVHIYGRLKELHGDKVILMDDRDDWESFDWIITE